MVDDPASLPLSLPFSAKARIDQVCLEFESAWQSKKEPRIEEYLAHVDQNERQRTALLRELLLLELDYRTQAGQQPAADEYHRRFPRDGQLIGQVFRQTAEADPVPPPGTRVRYFGDYELLEEIARGGMGVVYRARQLSLNRVVALKLVLAGQFASEEELERFRREARAAANLQHPNIVAIHETGQHEGQEYFSMALVEGRSLAEMTRTHPLPATQAARYVEIAARAVQYAHRRGTLHRDLKPANILIDGDDQPRITDFGLARCVDGSHLTQSGQVLGSPSYMPPEQAAGSTDRVGPASDVYALGAVLYDLVTGRPPFKAETTTETLLHVLQHEPVSIRALNPRVPRDLETICLKCLAKEPRRRYASAQELSDELARFLAGQPIRARPILLPTRSWRWCRRHPAVAGLAAALIVAILGGLLGIAGAARNEFRQRQRAEQAAEQNRQLLYVADMNVAQQAWESGNVPRVWELLERHRPAPGQVDLRGFHWQHLRRLCQAGMSRARTLPHASSVWRIAFSPDGQTLASVGHESRVSLWDVPGARLSKQLGDPGYGVSLAFFPDGKDLASCACYHDVMLWDLTQTEISGQPLKGVYHVYCMDVSPDRKMLATGGHGSAIQLWDVATGQLLWVLEQHASGPVMEIQFSPTGGTLASASDDQVIVWDVATGVKPRVLNEKVPGSHCVAFASDGKTLATGDPDGNVWLWDIERNEPIVALRGTRRGRVFSVGFSSDGRLAAGTNDGTVTIWDVSNPRAARQLEVLSGHQHVVFDLEFSPDNRLLATASWDATVKLWDVATRMPPDALGGHASEVTSVVFSRDGSVIASGCCDGTVQLWDAGTGELLSTRLDCSARITCLQASPDGRTLAVARWSDVVTLWDLAQGKPRGYLDRRHTSCMTFAPDGATVTCAGGGPRAEVWDVETGGCGHSTASGYTSPEGHRDMIVAVAISPDGQLLATGSWDKTIQLWDLATGRWRKTLTGHRGQVLCLDFSPAGTTLVSGGADTSVKLWNVDSGEVTRTLEGHASAVNDVAFSPDGRIVASASGDRTVRLWYLDSTKHPETLPHESPVTSVAFAPDGCTLASASGNRVRLWRTAPLIISAELEGLVSLERTAHGICQADADRRRQLFDRLKAHLVQQLPHRVRQRDIVWAVTTAQRLREGDNREAAAELLHELAKTLTQAGSQDAALRELAESWGQHVGERPRGEKETGTVTDCSTNWTSWQPWKQTSTWPVHTRSNARRASMRSPNLAHAYSFSSAGWPSCSNAIDRPEEGETHDNSQTQTHLP